MTKIIHDFPGYRVIQQPHLVHQSEMDEDIQRFKAGDTIAITRQTRHGILHTMYTLGSVVSYTLSYGGDPIEALDRARENGHKLHWANQNAVSITAYRREKKPDHYGVMLGQIIEFEGCFFRLDRAPNDNVNLTEMTVDTNEDTGEWEWVTLAEARASLAS